MPNAADSHVAGDVRGSDRVEAPVEVIQPQTAGPGQARSGERLVVDIAAGPVLGLDALDQPGGMPGGVGHDAFVRLAPVP